MIPNKKISRSEKRQFRLVKFFAYASFIVLIIFSFPLSMVVSKQGKDLLIRSYENYALLLGKNLNHQVYQNFMLAITVIGEKIELSEKWQYERMDNIVKTAIHGFNIELVNMYSLHEKVIAYSTDPALIGKRTEENSGYTRAVTGEHSSKMITEEGEYWGEDKATKGKKMMRTYIPLEGVNPYDGKEDIFSVFEIIQDLTAEYQSIVKFQYITFGISILMMCMIFVALLLIVRKAEGIMEQRARDQKEFESQLNQAERLAALGRMVAGVSHEIRNPLGIVRSTAELLGEMPDASEAQKRLSSVIIEESSRLNNIVTEFLDFARPLKPNLEDCYLDEIIKKNLEFLGPELEKEGISLHHNLDGKPFLLRADPHLHYRAFLNIFVNAMQSMKGGGTLTVNVAEQKDHYNVDIEDTGSGISEENLGKIFDPFYSTKDKGSGLGLSIVKNIIEAHNGNIRIESKEGLGTHVFIMLPKA